MGLVHALLNVDEDAFLHLSRSRRHRRTPCTLLREAAFAPHKRHVRLALPLRGPEVAKSVVVDTGGRRAHSAGEAVLAPHKRRVRLALPFRVPEVAESVVVNTGGRPRTRLLVYADPVDAGGWGAQVEETAQENCISSHSSAATQASQELCCLCTTETAGHGIWQARQCSENVPWSVAVHRRVTATSSTQASLGTSCTSR